MNYYQILEISESATAEQIKRAFRKLAKQYHPDVNKEEGANERFRLIYMAYDILQDPYKRRLYNELQKQKAAGYSHSQPSHMDEREYRRYRRRAEQQAHAYSQMRYEEFEESLLSKIGFHLSQGVAFILGFFIMCAGIVSFMVGSYFVFYEDFNGSYIQGYFFWAIGLAFGFTGGKMLWGVFDSWRTKG